jgi:hypothetical protein
MKLLLGWSSLKYLSEFVSAPAFYLSAEKLVGSMK